MDYRMGNEEIELANNVGRLMSVTLFQQTVPVGSRTPRANPKDYT